jgi:hypothetical protein
MAEAILYCPQCKNRLRIPEEMLGDVVQCPLCNLVFATPRPDADPGQPADYPDVLDAARAAVKTPATGLLLTGVLGLLIHLWQIGLALLTPDQVTSNPVFQLFDPPPPPEMLIRGALLGGIGFGLLNAFLIAAALKMMRLESYTLALIGSLAALIDCSNGCCLLAWPFGLWALVVLLRPEVKEAFR